LFVLFFGGGGWLFDMATAYTTEKILTQTMSKDVVLGQEVLFGVPKTIFNI